MKNASKLSLRTSVLLICTLLFNVSVFAQNGNWVWGGNNCLNGVQTLTYIPASGEEVTGLNLGNSDFLDYAQTESDLSYKVTPNQDFPVGTSVYVPTELFFADGTTATPQILVQVDQNCGIFLDPATNICRDQNVDINLIPKSGESYSNIIWQLPYGWKINNASSGNTSLEVQVEEDATSGRIYASFENNAGTAEEMSIPLFSLLPAKPKLSAINGPFLVCNQGIDLTYFTDNHSNANTYSWSLYENGSLINGWSTTIPELTISSLGLGNYELQVAATGDCGTGEAISTEIFVIQDMGLNSIELDEYNVGHNSLVGTSIPIGPTVIFNACDYADACFQREVDQARLVLTIDFGNTFTDHSTEFNLNLQGDLASYSELNGSSISSQAINVDLDPFEPEAKIILDLTTDLFNYVKHSFENISINSNADPLVDMRMTLSYEIEWKDNVQSTSALVEADGASPSLSSDEFNFTWNNLCTQNFKNYEIQVLRLFNKPGFANTTDLTGYIYDENADVYEVDWSKALSIETYSGNTSISLNMVEGPGLYTWRVRPIGDYFKGGIGNDRNWGQWSSDLQNGTINGIPSGPHYFVIEEQMDEDINWIYSRVFVEGNNESNQQVKIGEQMSFANGLNQAILNQSHSNSFGVIAQQGIYDYSGRQTINTLPVPTGQNHLGFNEDHLMKNTTGERYDAENFDACANFDNPEASNQEGVFSYYDGLGNDNNDFVPSAEGYPFSRTLLYSDGERVKEQGGVGATMRLKTEDPKTTKSYFGTPSQDELDRIFGEEAPIASSVQKIINQDPNKVLSGSYLSKDGKTLATFLIDNDENQEIADYQDADASYQTAVNSADQTLIGLSDKNTSFNVNYEVENHIPVGSNGVQVSSIINVPVEETINFEYELNPAKIQELCDLNGIDFCYECDYRVNFSLVNLEGPNCSDPGSNPDPNLLSTETANINGASISDFDFVKGHLVNAQNYTDADCSESFGATVTISFNEINLLPGIYQVTQSIFTEVYDDQNNNIWEDALDQILGQYTNAIDLSLETVAGGWLNGIQDPSSEFVFQAEDAYQDWLNNTYSDVIVVSQEIESVESPYNSSGEGEGTEIPDPELIILGFEIILLDGPDANCYESIFIPYFPCGDEPCPIDNFGSFDFVQNWLSYWNEIYANDNDPDTDPTLTVADFPFPGNYDQLSFNTLIQNMEAEQGIYSCSELITCWETARDIFYPGLSIDDQTQFGITFSAEPDIVDFILSCTGRNYIGFTNDAGTSSGTVISSSSAAPSYLTHAYAYVQLNPDCSSTDEAMVSCLNTNFALLENPNYDSSDPESMPYLTNVFEAWGWTDSQFSVVQNDASALPVFCIGVNGSSVPDWQASSFTSWPTDVSQTPQDLSNFLYTSLANCVNAQNAGIILTTEQEDYFQEEFYGDLELECFEKCESYYQAFKEELIEQHHQQGIYVDFIDDEQDFYLIPVYSVDEDYSLYANSNYNLDELPENPSEASIQTALLDIYTHSPTPQDWAYNFNWSIDDQSFFNTVSSITEEEINCMAMALVANCREACDLSFVNEAGIGFPNVVNGTTDPIHLAELEAMQEVMTAGGFEVYLNDLNENCISDNGFTSVSTTSTDFNLFLAPTRLEFVDALNNAFNDFVIYFKQGIESGEFTEYNGWKINGDPENSAYSHWQWKHPYFQGCYPEIGISFRNITEGHFTNDCLSNGLLKFSCLAGVTDPTILSKTYLYTASIHIEPNVLVTQIVPEWSICGGSAVFGNSTSVQTMLDNLLLGGFTSTHVEWFVNELGLIDATINYDPLSFNYQLPDGAFGYDMTCSAPGFYWNFLLLDGNNFWSQSYPNSQNFEEYISNSSCKLSCNNLDGLCFRWVNEPFQAPLPDDDEEPNGPYNCQDATADLVETEVHAQIYDLLQNIETTYRTEYENTCTDPLAIDDAFSYDRILGNYHYTLYYYDRSGNLIETVPPEGFVAQSYDTATEDYDQGITQHTMAANYKYNNLGQLVFQTTPDGGNSYFWYDDLGRLRLSQNDQQRVEDQFSYSKYDNLGRLIEVGEYTDFPFDENDNNTQGLPGLSEIFDADLYDEITSWIDAKINNPIWPTQNTNEVVETNYSKKYNFAGFEQKFLQNRVSRTVNYGQANVTDDNVRTYYSYDPHGNVEKLLQVIPGVGAKEMRYEYDLVSGNVLKVFYQEGEKDQLIHKYAYDADNRITSVYTSTDGVVWDNDADYSYYRHGPLKRVSTGEDGVQGTDYAYTIHGWLKAVNNVNMNVLSDPAEDGKVIRDGARDAFAMTLNYFEGDYNNSASPLATSSQQAMDLYANATNLYNGNISSWQSNLFVPSGSEGGTLNAGTDNHTANIYRYDELNRILTSRFARAQGATSWTHNDDYASGYIYDRNGNLQSLHRNAYQLAGFPKLIDKIDYTYGDVDQFGNTNNRLTAIADSGDENVNPADNYDDIRNGNNAYTYDEIGNLISDLGEEIENINWTVSGKIREIERTTGSQNKELEFIYDASGNRIAKISKPNDSDDITTYDYTYYVRDAQGNVMATYSRSITPSVCGGDNFTTEISLEEQPIYGSSRLGNLNRQELVGTGFIGIPCLDQAPDDFDFETGIVVEDPNPNDQKIAWVNQQVVDGEMTFSEVDNAIAASGGRNHGVISDENGIKLFSVASFEGYQYEDQVHSQIGMILDANEENMPGSFGISIHPESQVAAIQLNTSNQYLLFTIGIDGQPYYHLIDMSLNNGAGAIAQFDDGTYQKNLSFSNLPSPNYATALGLYCSADAGCWIVLRGMQNNPAKHTLDIFNLDLERGTPTDLARRIWFDTTDGQESPEMAMTPDGQSLVICNNRHTDELGDFSEIGILSYNSNRRPNPLTIQKRSFIEAEGKISSFAISENSDKMVFITYKSEDNSQKVYEYDYATDAVIEHINETRILGEGDVKRWSDGKLYISGYDYHQLRTMEFVNGTTLFDDVTVLDANGDYRLRGPLPDKYDSNPLDEMISASVYQRKLRKHYELSDHLGNVRTVITDRKLMSMEFGEEVLQPEVVAQNSYYPFGWLQPGRNFSSSTYRYGYQGSEKDDEFSGQGNTYTTYYRGLDSRLGRWWSVDPVVQPGFSPYLSMQGNPIWYNDPLGDKVRYGSASSSKKEIKRIKRQVKLRAANDLAFAARLKGLKKGSMIKAVFKDEVITDPNGQFIQATNVEDAQEFNISVGDNNNVTLFAWNIRNQSIPNEINFEDPPQGYANGEVFRVNGQPIDNISLANAVWGELEKIAMWLESDPERELTLVVQGLGFAGTDKLKFDDLVHKDDKAERLRMATSVKDAIQKFTNISSEALKRIKVSDDLRFDGDFKTPFEVNIVGGNKKRKTKIKF